MRQMGLEITFHIRARQMWLESKVEQNKMSGLYNKIYSALYQSSTLEHSSYDQMHLQNFTEFFGI